MLNVHLLQEAVKPLLTVYQEMEDELLTNIASRLKMQPDGTIVDINEWHKAKLLEMGQVNKKNISIIAQRSGRAAEDVAQIMTDAGYDALKYDETVYKRAREAGKLNNMPYNPNQSLQLRRILRAAVQAADEQMNLINTTCIGSARNAYLNAVNKTYLQVITGTRDYNSAIRQAVKELGDSGIKGLDYLSANGKRTTAHLEVAVRRNVMTASSQLAGDMQIKRAEEWGSDLIEVDSHVGSRPSHAEWQGRVYSRSGKSTKYPPFFQVTKYGSIDGLKGINCRHDFYPFFEGFSEQTFKPYDPEENDRIYQLSQQQRSLERDVRATKRRLVASEAAGDHEQVLAEHRALRSQQAKLRQFEASSGLPRMNEREQIYGYRVGSVGRARDGKAGIPPKKDLPKDPPNIAPNPAQGGAVAPKTAPIPARQYKSGIVNIRTSAEAQKVLLEDVGFTSAEANIFKIGEECLTDIAEQLRKMEDKFGVVHQSNSFFTTDMRRLQASGAVSSSIQNPLQQNMMINPKGLTSRAAEQKTWREAMDAGEFVRAKEGLEHLHAVTHEYGHMVQNKLTYDEMEKIGFDVLKSQINWMGKSQRTIFKAFIKVDEDVAKSHLHEIVEIAKAKNPNINIAQNISKYGRTSEAEFFAEAFANSQLGAPNEIGDAMNIFLERRGYK